MTLPLRYKVFVWSDEETCQTFNCWSFYYMPREGKMIFQVGKNMIGRIRVNLGKVYALMVIDQKNDTHAAHWSPEYGYFSEYTIKRYQETRIVV